MKTNQSNCVNCSIRCRSALNSLPEERLEAFAHSNHINVYRPGQIIYYEDNKPFGVYCMKSGKVKLTKYTPDGKIYITRIAQAGDLLGYRELLSQQVHSATAEVIETAAVCFMDANIFREALQNHPEFTLQIMTTMGNELKTAEEQARDLAYTSVSERLIRMLLSMKENYGKIREDGSVLLDIQLTREELASMLGTTVETTVRTLSRFRQEHLIAQDHKRVILKDLEKLNRMAL